MRGRITWFYIWRLKMTAIKFALQMKMEGLSNILLQCLENSGHISTERNTAFDCAFDGYKIYWWKNEMNKNCGIIRGNSDFQGKMDRYGKAGTVWKIEKNIYNQEQISQVWHQNQWEACKFKASHVLSTCGISVWFDKKKNFFNILKFYGFVPLYGICYSVPAEIFSRILPISHHNKQTDTEWYLSAYTCISLKLRLFFQSGTCFRVLFVAGGLIQVR